MTDAPPGSGRTGDSSQGPDPPADQDAAGGEAPRSAVRLLGDRTVGSYFVTLLLAAIGMWVYNVVAAIVVFDATGSALLVGTVSVAQFAPQVFLAPWMGAVADRGNRRRQVVVGRLTATAGSAALAVWTMFVGVDTPTGAGVVIAAALVVGVGFAISIPAMQAILPALVRPSELPNVVALQQIPFTIARAAGPAIGGFLMVFMGPAAGFVIAAIGQAAFALVMGRIPLRTVTRSRSADGSVRSGLRYLRTDVGVALLLLAVAGLGFGVDPVITLTPPLADGFGGGAELVATMASAFGVGAALVVLLIGPLGRRMPQDVLGTAGLGVLAAGLLALAVSPTPELAIASLFVGGMGMMAAVTSLTTQLQQRIPEDLRGRIMALWTVCFIGSRPLAASLNGAVADLWSPEAALVLLVALLAVAAALTRPSRLRRSTPR